MGEKKFILPEEGIVTIKFVKRKVGIAASVDDNHIISGGMLEGAYKKFPAPLTRSGSIKNVLTKEEKEFYESEIYPGENLSAYGKFWHTFYVKIAKEGIILDKSDPIDYLKYKILLGWSNVIAPNLKAYKDHPLPSYMFYMEEAGEEMKMRSKELNITKQAWKNFNKIEDDQETLAAVIFLMSGKKVAGNAKVDYLNTEVERIVDTKPEKFNDLIEDMQFEMKVFVANAEREGIIVKTKKGYYTKDDLPVTGNGKAATINNVVKFLLDPINNEVKELIASRIDNIKE